MKNAVRFAGGIFAYGTFEAKKNNLSENRLLLKN